MSDEFDGQSVQVAAHAEVLDLPEAMEPLVEYFRIIAGEHDDWDDYRRAMERRGRCVIRVTITDWGPIATGGFPPRLSDDGPGRGPPASIGRWTGGIDRVSPR